MIKAVLEGRDGTPSVLLGLSRTNTERLHAGLPIEIKITDLGIDYDLKIVLIAGETEEAMKATLYAAVGQDPNP